MSVESLTEEEAMDVFDWAYNAAAAIIILHSLPPHTNARDGLEQLGYIKRTNQSMYEDMPDVLLNYAFDRAQSIIDTVNEQETVVEEFLEELDAFNNEN